MERNENNNKVIFIIGPTAVGKSELAIEICKKFNGEVISADSMQIYKNLDVLTNKVLEKDMQSVKHHLISTMESEDRCDVLKFMKMALEIIDDIHRRNKLAVVVGGTNYYIESILYENYIECPKDIIESSLDHIENEFTFEILNKINPSLAARTHPNDYRRIRNHIIMSKYNCLNEDMHRTSLRFKENGIVLNLICEKNELIRRITNRCLKMYEVSKNEIVVLEDQHNQSNRSRNSSPKGLRNAIGYQEISLEVENEKSNNMERFIKNTIKYAKKQSRWIKNRILAYKYAPKTYSIDCTSIDQFFSHSVVKALNIIDTWYLGTIDSYYKPDNSITIDYIEENNSKNISFIKCPTCQPNIYLFGNTQWKQHIKSKKHKYQVKKNL